MQEEEEVSRDDHEDEVVDDNTKLTGVGDDIFDWPQHSFFHEQIRRTPLKKDKALEIKLDI